MRSKSVLLKNMFDPEEFVASSHPHPPHRLTSCLRETERDWDKDLADDVKSECETKYGKVDFIKVERESQVRVCLFIQTCLLHFL